DVGVGGRLVRAQETPDVALVSRGVAGAEEKPFQSDQGHLVGSEQPIDGDRLPALPLQVEFNVVVKIGADAGQIVDRANAETAKVIRRTHARKHQQLGRAHGARTEDHLSFGPGFLPSSFLVKCDAYGSITLEQYAHHRRLAADL